MYHHGILGQKWGKKNGPPYPLDADDHSKFEEKAGWRNSIGSFDDFYKGSSKRIRTNKDGSKTIPKGFVLNRVGEDHFDPNKSGVLYASDNKNDTARYIKSLGPSLIGKLTNQAHTTIQHISVTSSLKVPSEDQLSKQKLEFACKNDDFMKKYNESIYQMLFTDSLDPEVLVKPEDIKKMMDDPSSKKAKKFAYSVSAMIGNDNHSEESKQYIDYLKKNGWDAIPDLVFGNVF